MGKNRILYLGIIIFLFITPILIIYAQENINKPRWITAELGLNMRSSPDLKAKRIDLIPYAEEVLLIEETGELITISGATGKWSKIKWKGKTGWVFGGFLSNKVVGIPPAGQVLPLPAGIAAGKDSTVTIYNMQGEVLASRTVTGISWMARDQVQPAGSLVQGANNLPLVYYSLRNKGTLKLNVNDIITDLTPMPDLVSIISAEGRSYLASVTLDMTSGSMDAMKLYMGNLDQIAGMPPRINWGHLPEPKHGNIIQPLAIYYAAGQAHGLWFAYGVYGIGGFIIFPIPRGLFYLELKSNKITEFIPASLTLQGISPDQTLVAYNPTAASDSLTASGFTVRYIFTNKEVHFKLDPKSNLGAGNMVFSPDNKFIAWKEASGPDNEQAEFRLRVARTDGTNIFNAPAASLSSLLGVDAVSSATPVGWASNHLLLLQVYSEMPGQSFLVLWAPGPAQPPDPLPGASRAITISNGIFIGFIYP